MMCTCVASNAVLFRLQSFPQYNISRIELIREITNSANLI